MFRDKGRSIRHRVEQWPKGSIATSIVVRIEDNRVEVYCHNLENKYYDLFNPAVEYNMYIDIN